MSKPLGPMNWKLLLKHNDVLLAVGMVLIVAMMMIPIPAGLLDILLTINIALAVTILLVTIYTNEPLQYSTFPTMLLVYTLFRLGLHPSDPGPGGCGPGHRGFRELRHRRQLRGGSAHLHHSGHHQLHRHHQRRGPGVGSSRPLHVGCHARQAIEH